jgi:hypothetical protein
VLKVLPERILESELPPMESLSPGVVVGTPEDPAAHVLCLDDKYTVWRNDNVVDLRRSVLGWQRHIV